MIFMDRTESPLFESVVTFTASIVRSVLKQNSTASFVSVGKERTIFPLDNGDMQLQQIFSFSESTSRQCIPALPECRNGIKKNVSARNDYTRDK